MELFVIIVVSLLCHRQIFYLMAWYVDNIGRFINFNGIFAKESWSFRYLIVWMKTSFLSLRILKEKLIFWRWRNEDVDISEVPQLKNSSSRFFHKLQSHFKLRNFYWTKNHRTFQKKLKSHSSLNTPNQNISKTNIKLLQIFTPSIKEATSIYTNKALHKSR